MAMVLWSTQRSVTEWPLGSGGVKKGFAFLSWYVKVSEFQSSPNQGLSLLD